jgi:hypothetical protein
MVFGKVERELPAGTHMFLAEGEETARHVFVFGSDRSDCRLRVSVAECESGVHDAMVQVLVGDMPRMMLDLPCVMKGETVVEHRRGACVIIHALHKWKERIAVDIEIEPIERSSRRP